ncbi:MAG: hypothetical protein JOS17DRAFT_746694 [Linnemannia elongata]|nr:MAG: hypothetical protein JOS17DRAFT_746694 [Linnemannia elongata]
MWVNALYLFISLINFNMSSVNAQLISLFTSLRSLIHTNPISTIAQTVLSVPLPLHTNSHRSSCSRPTFHCPFFRSYRNSSLHFFPSNARQVQEPEVSSSTNVLLDQTKIDCETFTP